MRHPSRPFAIAAATLLLAACQAMVESGFVLPADLDCMKVGADIDQLLSALSVPGGGAAPAKPS